MNVFDLSFVPPRRLRPLPAAALLASALLLALAARGVFFWSGEARRSLAHWQSLAGTQAATRDAEERSRAAPPLSPDRARAINTAVAALNVPWPQLLSAIEASRPRGATLLRLEPRPQEATVRVTAQAHDIETLVEFMRSTASAPPFVASRPVQQERVDAAGSPAIVSTFELRWRRQP